MTSIDQPSPRRRGGTPKWSPDNDSIELLTQYRTRRMADTPTPATTTVRSECNYLRSMVFTSIGLGGPSTLRGLRDDPDTVARVAREGPYTQRTLRGMLAAMLRLIGFTVPDTDEGARLRDRIAAGLIPRPNRSRTWNLLPGRVGGSNSVQRRRPALSLHDLRRIVKAATLASPSSAVALRDQALAALLCFSGVTPYEIPTLRLDRIQWLETSPAHPWCAVLLGIQRRGSFVNIPVAQEAGRYLKTFIDSGRVSSGHLFTSTRRRGDCPLSYAMVRRVMRLATENAGIGACDDLTLKRAYATHLKEEAGLTDYQIRDAFGLNTTSAVDRRLAPHRRKSAQQLIIEEPSNQREAPSPPERRWMQLHLDGYREMSCGDRVTDEDSNDDKPAA